MKDDVEMALRAHLQICHVISSHFQSSLSLVHTDEQTKVWAKIRLLLQWYRIHSITSARRSHPNSYDKCDPSFNDRVLNLSTPSTKIRKHSATQRTVIIVEGNSTLFALFVVYSLTICTIRNYSPFINCPAT